LYGGESHFCKILWPKFRAHQSKAHKSASPSLRAACVAKLRLSESRQPRFRTQHPAYSKHAEVTVPSLDDWEKQWKKNPYGMKQPNKVVAVDFWSNLDAPPSAGRNGSAARRCRL
jgi:hypothetical protein